MTAYFKCLCRSSEKIRAKKLIEEGYVIKITKSNPEFMLEAKSYGLKMPFKVTDGVAEKL